MCAAENIPVAFSRTGAKRRESRPRSDVGVDRGREGAAWALRVRGCSESAIAAQLGVSRAVVRALLERAQERVLAEEARVQATKARQAGQLEYFLNEAMNAWERSKLPARKGRRKRVVDKSPRRELVREWAERDGDPRWLAEARAILESERRLWGIGQGEDVEEHEPAQSWDDIQRAVRTELLQGLSADERLARLTFQAEQASRHLAALQHQIQTEEAPPHAETTTTP